MVKLDPRKKGKEIIIGEKFAVKLSREPADNFVSLRSSFLTGSVCKTDAWKGINIECGHV